MYMTSTYINVYTNNYIQCIIIYVNIYTYVMKIENNTVLYVLLLC